MADICIIYASEDRAIAEKLFGLLSQQWDTWWDDKIVGRFPGEIETEIRKSRCIVPLFSAFSVGKNTVRDELKLGEKYEKKILPVELDDSTPPFGFSDYTRVNMLGWEGEIDHSGFKQLQRKISSVVLPRESPPRLNVMANGKVPLPTVIMSVSSFNTNLDPSDAVRVLRAFEAPAILVSAYDLDPRREEALPMIKELKKYQKNGGFVLIDSGNYEASKLKDESWVADNLKEVLLRTPHDWVFCFDKMDPSMGYNLAVKEIVEAVERDQKLTTAPILPIIHAPKLKKGGYKLEKIPKIVRKISEQLEPSLIAIPERELGAGIIARAKMVREIRKELNSLPYYQTLHILGTGNPWSIAVLAAAGADTFDGLEWCRYTIDADLETINHFHLFDFYDTTNNSKIGFGANAVLHNLSYFTSFANVMQDMFDKKKIESFVQGILSKNAFNMLIEQFPEIFE